MDKPRRVPKLIVGPIRGDGDVVAERKVMFERWMKEALEG